MQTLTLAQMQTLHVNKPKGKHCACFRVRQRDCGLYSTLSKTRSQRKTAVMLIAQRSRKVSSEKTRSSRAHPGSRRSINATGNVYLIIIFIFELHYILFNDFPG